jgi:hypothetical protein
MLKSSVYVDAEPTYLKLQCYCIFLLISLTLWGLVNLMYILSLRSVFEVIHPVCLVSLVDVFMVHEDSRIPVSYLQNQGFGSRCVSGSALI